MLLKQSLLTLVRFTSYCFRGSDDMILKVIIKWLLVPEVIKPTLVKIMVPK